MLSLAATDHAYLLFSYGPAVLALFGTAFAVWLGAARSPTASGGAAVGAGFLSLFAVRLDWAQTLVVDGDGFWQSWSETTGTDDPFHGETAFWLAALGTIAAAAMLRFGRKIKIRGRASAFDPFLADPVWCQRAASLIALLAFGAALGLAAYDLVGFYRGSVPHARLETALPLTCSLLLIATFASFVTWRRKPAVLTDDLAKAF